MNPVSFGFGVASSCESSLGATDLAAPLASTDAEPGAFGAVFEKSCALAPAASDEGETADADIDDDPSQAAYAALIAASTLASADVAPAPLPPPAPAALLGTGSGMASNAEKNGASFGVATRFRESATSATSDVTHAAGATIGGDHDASSSASPGAGSDASAQRALDARVAKADVAPQASAPDAESAMKAEADESVRAKPALAAGGAIAASGSAGISIAGLTPVTPTTASGLAAAPIGTVTRASSDADVGAQASAAAAAMTPQVSQMGASTAVRGAHDSAREPNASSTSVDRAKRPGAVTVASQPVRPQRARIASANAGPSARLADAMDDAAEAKVAATGEGMQGELGNAHATAFSSASATEGRKADVAAAGALTPNDDRLTNVSASTPNAAVEMGSAHRAGREHAIETASRAADRHAISRGVHAEIELGDAGRVQVHASRPDDRIHVRLDADAASTARALGEHARDLARELQTSSHDARVTVSGPTTHASVSSDGSARGDRGMAGGNGSPQERDERTARSTNDDGTHARSTSKTHSPGSRARFVL